LKFATTKERTMKFEVLSPKRGTSTRPPLPARVLSELRTLADLWGNPGDDVDATPPPHLSKAKARRHG
jgi:hypothetical protein